MDALNWYNQNVANNGNGSGSGSGSGNSGGSGLDFGNMLANNNTPNIDFGQVANGVTNFTNVLNGLNGGGGFNVVGIVPSASLAAQGMCNVM